MAVNDVIFKLNTTDYSNNVIAEGYQVNASLPCGNNRTSPR